jgi:hypothetical protein
MSEYVIQRLMSPKGMRKDLILDWMESSGNGILV